MDDVVFEAPNVPKENPDDVAVALFGAAACPGLGDSHAIHVVLSASLETMHTSHVQDPAFFINFAKRSSAGGAVTVAAALFDSATCPGLGDSHAIHVVLSASLVIIHTSHVQDPAFFLNLAKRSSAGGA